MMRKVKRFGNITLSKENKIVKLLPFMIIGVASYFAYYLLNINTPPFGDDIFNVLTTYGLDGNNPTPVRITNFGQIIANSIGYYLSYRGRIVAEVLEIVFAVYGKHYFNYINPFVFTGMTYLVYYHANYEKKANYKLFLIVCAVFWFLAPNMTMSYLMMVCSFYIVWPIFFILLFLLPYRKLLSEKGEIKHPGWVKLYLIPTGFLAGTLNEQSFGLSIGFVVITMLVLKIRNKRVPSWAIAGLVSVLCGAALLFLSPGYRNNTNDLYGVSPLKLLFRELPYRIYGAALTGFRVTWVLMIFAVAVFIWIIISIKKTDRINQKKERSRKPGKTDSSFKSFIQNPNGLLMPGIYFITSIACVANTIPLPYYDFRLFFTVFASFSLVFFSLLSELISRMDYSQGMMKKNHTKKFIVVALPVLISLFTVFDFIMEFKVYHQHFEVYTSVVDSIEKKIAAGEKDIIVRNVTEIPKMLLPERRLRSFVDNYSVTGLTNDASAQVNTWYAYYFEVDTIKGERSANNPPFSFKDGRMENSIETDFSNRS